jgi:hypothetical protein
VKEALESLHRSVAADATQPRGTVYFLTNGDVRATTREPAFISAVLALKGTPVAGRVLPGVLPDGKADVAGAMVGSASFNWQQSGATMLPGAICEHLTSYGGIMTEGSGQTPLTEFIRHGAAGSSGTVTEPLAIPAKFPLAFLHVHYARGCSLAEAFYQSVFGPYQLLIVGDPLCQPWARPLRLKVDSPSPGQSISGVLTIKPSVLGGATEEARLGRFEMYLDGRQGKLPPDARVLNIDTRQLGDGWHELSVVAVANDAVETRSRVTIPIEIRNGVGGVSLRLVGQTAGRVTYGDEFAVNVSAPLQAQLSVAGNGSLLGSVDGPEGELKIDTRQLGMGPVRLQAGTLIEGKPVFSEPVVIRVEPRDPEPAPRDVPAGQLKPGIALSIGTGPIQVVAETKPANWLADLKPAAGQTLKLEGYVQAAVADLHQFQFRGNAIHELRLNGRVLWQADSAQSGAVKWTMVPVNLEAGYHRLEIRGEVSASPTLEVRFGCQGCFSLGQGNVQYKAS